jgi:uncharacterized membrane protein YvbJ
MPHCQYCGGQIDKDTALCPKCGRGLVGEDAGVEKTQAQEMIDKAKHKANMYTISAIVLITVGIIGGVLCVAWSSLGLFGIVLVCLGIGCTARADRYESKARNLTRQLSQSN